MFSPPPTVHISVSCVHGRPVPELILDLNTGCLGNMKQWTTDDTVHISVSCVHGRTVPELILDLNIGCLANMKQWITDDNV